MIKMDAGGAIEEMNRLGAARRPFLFIIDFDMKDPLVFSADEVDKHGIRFNFRGTGNLVQVPSPPRPFRFLPHPVNFDEYLRAFRIVTGHIDVGDSYLVNLTFPTALETDLELGEVALRSKAPYVLLVPERFVVFSPETFVRIRNGKISSYPMKGTIDASVENAGQKIMDDPKEIAEHNTIVDLIRNDLSMVASKVRVDRFRYVERVRTHQRDLLQVSSEISGTLPENFHTRIGEIIFRLLPAGSVSGAPKRKTVEIIHEAEPDDRGYYTGVTGFYDGNDLDSAVMIRFIEKKGNDFYFRSGGGITCFSDPVSEYRELLEKVYVPFY